MFSATYTTKRLGAALAAAAAVAAFAAPSALAGGPGQPEGSQTPVTSLNARGDIDGYYRLEPGLRPGVVNSAAATPTVATVVSSGFDWSSFGIGIGTGMGVLLIVPPSRAGSARSVGSSAPKRAPPSNPRACRRTRPSARQTSTSSPSYASS
jgi:hypothetical protein